MLLVQLQTSGVNEFKRPDCASVADKTKRRKKRTRKKMQRKKNNVSVEATALTLFRALLKFSLRNLSRA